MGRAARLAVPISRPCCEPQKLAGAREKTNGTKIAGGQRGCERYCAMRRALQASYFKLHVTPRCTLLHSPRYFTATERDFQLLPVVFAVVT